MATKSPSPKSAENSHCTGALVATVSCTTARDNAGSITTVGVSVVVPTKEVLSDCAARFGTSSPAVLPQTT